jgi:endonuclease/exonuclease/phosphatase (EEP) superfamily protein YafD
MEAMLISVLQIALLAGTGMLALLTLAGFWGALNTWLDYASHFRPHLVAGALLAMTGAPLLFQWQHAALLACLSMALAVVNVAVILAERRYQAPRAPAGGDSLTLAAVNVRFRNRQLARVDAWIRRTAPDILVVTEVGPTWVATIEGLADLYPYRAIGRTRYVTMLSRRPWARCELVAGPRPEQGILVARFDLDGATLTVIGAHPASPVDPRRVKSRDLELGIIGGLARQAPGPVAAMGDFNATPWSAPMRRLVRTSPLRYADLHTRTWPVALPRWLGIKLDHIMLGQGCAVVDYSAGPDIGSDHRPVMARIRYAPSASSP